MTPHPRPRSWTYARDWRSNHAHKSKIARRAGAWLAALVLGVIGVAGVGAAPAWAHAALVGSSPAADSLLQDAPTQVVLTFTESVNPVGGKVKVIAPDGSRADRDEARASGLQLIIPLKTIETPGTYLVTFRVISADSHPVGGAFTFHYLQVSPGGPPSADAGGSSSFALAALPVARWIGYIGLTMLVGAVLVLALLWPRRLDRTGATRIVYLGAALVALGTVLELAFQVPYVAGGVGSVTGSDVREVLSSQYGAAHLIRLGVLAAALVLLRPVVRGRGSGTDRILLAVLGVVGIATWSMSGHPSATSVPTVTVTADMIHLASMSVWLGGLAMLAIFLLPRGNATELGAIVPVWSRWATYAIGALLVTGVAQALIEVGSVDALIETTYGLMIVAKVALVGVVLAVAAWSRRLVASVAPEPLVDGDDEPDDGDDEAEPTEVDAAAQAGAVSLLRRSVIIEAAVAVVIIGLTSVLVQVTPARTSAEPGTEYSTVQSAVLTDPRFVLTVDLTPATVGVNQVHLYASTSTGLPLTVVEWTVRASNEEAGVESIEAVVVRITDDHATGQIGLPTAGNWRFTFTLRLDEITNGTVTTNFLVRP